MGLLDCKAMEAGAAVVAVDGASSAEEQEKWLADAIALVQHNAFYMHRALVSNAKLINSSFLPPIVVSIAQTKVNLV